VFTLKKSERVLIKGHKSFIQDQKVRNACLCLQERENRLDKTISPKKPLKIKGLGFDHSMLESIKNLEKTLYIPLRKFERKKKENMENHEGNTLLIDPIVKVRKSRK
jgi:hypothetical protein